MDLRTQRLVRPEPDSVMLAPHHSLFLGAFSAQDSQKHLPQHIHYEYDMEQSRQEKEQDKRQELQQLMYKDKSEQSAVASPLVKQKLRSQILKRTEQAALETTASNPTRNTPRSYRELAPDPDMPPKPHMVTPVVHHPPCDQRKDTPLRRTVCCPHLLQDVHHCSCTQESEASDPLLKVRSKLKKHINSRQNPLQRKTSTPPTIKPRMPDTLDSSPSSSTCSTPVSGCSSPNDSLLSDSPLTTGLTHVAQRLLLQDGTLAHFMVPCSTALPSISTGLPGHGDWETGSYQRVARVLPQVYLPMERHSAAHHHLQPMFILEPSGLLHTQLVTVRGLNPGLIQYPSSRLEGLATLGPHRPLGRTRSEPPLHSHQQHQLLQQNHNLLLERLKQNTHLDQSFHWEQSRHLQVLTERHRPVTYLDPLGVPVVLGPSHRPLGRAKSSPTSTSLPPPPQPTDTPLSLASTGPETPTKLQFTTGLVYDSQMLKHQCTCGDNSRHPEHAGRIQSIWSRLQESGLRNQCECICSRKASLEELQSVHSEKHVLLYGTNLLHRLKLDNRKLAGILSQRMRVMLRCGGVGVDNDTIWNEMHTSTASRLAAGSVTELALRVTQGELKNGFAVVRPPGHHAAHSTPLGFCFFNSVAIAAKQLQHKLGVSKILIVDWDVHHGNGTQSVFYNDPSVLYISLHRYDNGKFFPGSGDPAEVGVGAGEGFNVNVAWTGGLDPPMGDAEYLAAFRTVVMPIAYEFCPDVVLVSSGFDAVEGHLAPLGGYKVSAKCFGFLTRQLMGLAGGRVVMALEGGHELTAICDASEACVRALLGIQEPLSEAVLERRPCPNAVLSLQRVIQAQGEYWRSLRVVAHTVDQSYMQAQGHSLRRGSEDHNDTVSALASLSMASLTTNRTQPDELMEGDRDSM
ncbi:histone deacetylase 7-like isoform X3 [Oncorhynchus tshawytscha]|uniref:Histone deacetylase n=1 Tax=Oncorhynchus tshawytscha TaxID=74940 RepID=A0AAZ3SQQ3_ONCTS|nr:histone deacetylase 7-like isoform X3 [Oncorhynchus tshawytscha]